MLVLSRKMREEIVVPGCDLVITVLEVRGDKVSIGITAPRDVKVYRREVWRRITLQAALNPAVTAEPPDTAAPALPAAPTP